MPTVSVICNFHREPHSLPSFIKHAEAFFDEVVFVSSPPDGVEPCEESLSIVKASGHRLVHFTVSKGFGVLRTRCLRESKGDWTMILDADEVISVSAPRMVCIGTEKYPETKTPDLKVQMIGGEVNQRDLLREMISRCDKSNIPSLCLSRRHWFNAPGLFESPCQPWGVHRDWQLRCIANSPFLFYDPEWRMHEKLLWSPTWSEPRYLRADSVDGPFIDHHHCFYKPLDPKKNKLDMETYQKLDKPNTEGMWLESADGVKE